MAARKPSATTWAGSPDTAVSNRSCTTRPAAEATRSTSRLVAGRRLLRAARTSRRRIDSDASASGVTRPDATSSSVYRGLPPLSAWIRPMVEASGR